MILSCLLKVFSRNKSWVSLSNCAKITEKRHWFPTAIVGVMFCESADPPLNVVLIVKGLIDGINCLLLTDNQRDLVSNRYRVQWEFERTIEVAIAKCWKFRLKI